MRPLSRLIPFILFFSTGLQVYAGENGLARFREIRANPILKAELISIVEAALLRAFGEAAELPQPKAPELRAPLGVFVTAKKNGEVRGCVGTLHPLQVGLPWEIAANLKRALFLDPRHRPVRREEIAGMEFYLTTAADPKLVDRIESISPARDAILLKAGNKEAVVLPGEAKTLRYLLAFAKVKAGIKKGDHYRVYRLSSETIKVK
ncbi:MAG TPA: hypothetical protein DF383_13760 [Deltaproteobacteria bacterium]|nr:hypothetical protein [Deltaproteobacteria bacterium]